MNAREVKHSAHVNSPISEEFSTVMECAPTEIIEPDHTFAVVKRIISAQAEEAVLDEKGTVDASKLNVLMFSQFQEDYYPAGEKIGKPWNAGAWLMKSEK